LEHGSGPPTTWVGQNRAESTYGYMFLSVWHIVRARAVRTYVLELVHIVCEMTSVLITCITCSVTRWRAGVSTTRTSRTAWIHYHIQSTILIRRHALPVTRVLLTSDVLCHYISGRCYDATQTS